MVLPNDEVDAWLGCRDPELARSFLRSYPAEAMKAWAAPRTPPAPSKPAGPVNLSLF